MSRMLKILKKILQYPRLTVDYPRTPFTAVLGSGRPVVEKESCTLCGQCVQRCPSSAVVLDRNMREIGFNLDECIFCSLCAQICPAGAITISGDFELAQKYRGALRFLTYEDLGVRMEAKIRKIFGRSLHIREVDAGSCNGCDYEINAMTNPLNDLERFGVHFVASPRHADMLLVTGAVTRNMESALRKTYQAVPDPKLVVAVGACACSGGIFRDSYAAQGGVDAVLPVDVYIPGCPPRPQAIIYGVLKALDPLK